MAYCETIALQVKVELQADCYVGIWAHHAHKKSGRQVNPDGFTHGTSAQRMAWLKRGLSSGDMRECDTFK